MGSEMCIRDRFWSFVAGFNQNYVVDLIDNIKGSQKTENQP
mgnify:CR=1 FL=1